MQVLRTPPADYYPPDDSFPRRTDMYGGTDENGEKEREGGWKEDFPIYMGIYIYMGGRRRVECGLAGENEGERERGGWNFFFSSLVFTP